MFFFFFFNDTATTEIYTLSLHDALPIPVLSAFRRKFPEPVDLAVWYGHYAVRIAVVTAVVTLSATTLTDFLPPDNRTLLAVLFQIGSVAELMLAAALFG